MELKTKQALEYLKNFGLGFIVALGGGSGQEVNACLPDSWKIGALANDATGGDSAEKLAGSNRALQIIVKVVGAVTNILCGAFKGKFMDFVKGIVGGGKKRFMFVEKKKWFGAKLVKGAVNTAKKVGKTVVKTVKTVAKTVVKVAKDVGNKIKEIAEKFNPVAIFNKIKDGVKDFIAKIKSFFNAKFVKDLIQSIMKCKNAIQTLISNVRKVIQVISALAASSGFSLAPMIVGAICAWREFVKAVDYLKEGITSSGAARWYQFGKFSGQLLVLFGNVGSFK
jgi:hypothetical protein